MYVTNTNSISLLDLIPRIGQVESANQPATVHPSPYPHSSPANNLTYYMAPAGGKGPNKTGIYYHQSQYPPQQPSTQTHHGSESNKLKQEGVYFSPNPSEPFSGPSRPEQVGGPSATPLSAAAIASHGHGHGQGVYGSFATGVGQGAGAGAGLASGDDDDATSPSSQGHGGYDQTPTPQSGSGGGANRDEGNGHQGTSATTSTNPKKRKTVPGSRGVANLTPEQLAKKRANGE